MLDPILITSHLGRHFRIFGHYDYKVLLEMGKTVHIAANFKDPIDHFEDSRLIKHQIDFDRNPLSFRNLRAYYQLSKVLKQYKYDIIHCQSPTGGAITRMAGRKAREKGAKILYTAHGFHFFKGAPLKNWFLFLGIEKMLSNYTDALITINNEDYANASKFMPKVKTYRINGVGIDLTKYTAKSGLEKGELRNKYGFQKSDYILIFAGELSRRKNQSVLISAISLLKSQSPDIKLLLVGTGELESEYKNLVDELGLHREVIMMGYRKDVADLLAISDLLVSASRQEGLPLNVLEGMAAGLPLVVSDCRGNRDLVSGNGIIVEDANPVLYAQKIMKMYTDRPLQKACREKSLQNAIHYSTDLVSAQMLSIYGELS